MSDKKKNYPPLVSIISGSTAGMVETCCVWPMEMIKTQLQLNRKFNGFFDCAKYTYQQNGVLGFYRGLAPVLIGSIPKAGIRFGGFNIIQGKLKNDDGSISPLKNFVAGVCAGSLEAIVAVTPIETVKTKLIDGNSSFIKGLTSIVRTEGVGGLYKGALATVGKQGSNQGLRFMAFGMYKNFMTKSDPQRKLTALESLAGGMGAGCFSTLCNNPFDMIKTRMQGLRASEYNGFIDCLSKVVNNEGVMALWKGTGPRLARVGKCF